MTQMKQTKNFRTLATLSNHNTTVPPMNSIRESEPQICNSNAAKFVTCDKIDPSDVNSSTDDNYSGKVFWKDFEKNICNIVTTCSKRYYHSL